MQGDNTALQGEIDAAETSLGGSGTLANRISAISTAIGGFGTDGAYPPGTGMAIPQTVSSRLSDAKTVLGFGGADLATDLQTLNTTRLGGLFNTTTASRLTAIDTALGGGGGGSVTARVGLVGFKLLIHPSGDLTADVGTVNTLINGTTSGPTLEDALGAPTVNGTASNLAAMIGGTGSLAARIGDPVTGTGGLAGKVRNNGSATDNTGTAAYAAKFTAFNNATTLSSQLDAFFDVYTVNPASGRLQWDNPLTLGSLRAVLTAALDN